MTDAAHLARIALGNCERETMRVAVSVGLVGLVVCRVARKVGLVGLMGLAGTGC